jgi:hypothetical protein
MLILSLATALVLLGITRLRQEAASMRCRNNLKQLGIAVQNYHDCMGHLPHLVDQGEGSSTGSGVPSAFHTLIPFLEATPILYRPGQSPPSNYHAHSSVPFQFDGKDGEAYTQFGGMANQVWHIFIDPADSTAERLRDVPMTLPDGSTGYYATGSYAANGLMPWGVRKLLAFPGGMSSAVLMSERPQVCRPASGDDVYNLWGVGFYSPHMPAFATLTPVEPAGLWSTGQIAPVIPLNDDRMVRIGRQDAKAGPADFATAIQWVRKGMPCDPRLPGTPHRSGLHAVMVDGSVRVFSLDTDAWVFWAACDPGSK